MATQDQLTEAQNAYHLLMTGRATRVLVDQNGERVEYVPADAAKLAAYIEQLKRELNDCSISRPMRAWF